MQISWVLQITFIILLQTLHKENVYAVITDIESLKITHGSVINTIEEYLVAEEKRLDKIKVYLNSLRSEHIKMGDPEEYASNPMNFFKLVKRLSYETDFISYLASDVSDFYRRPDLFYPSMEDLDQAVVELNKAQIASMSDWDTVSYSTPASTSECYIIGQLLYYQQQYERAIQWLYEALYKFDVDEPKPFDKTHIVRYLRSSYHDIGDIKSARRWSKELYAISNSYKFQDEEVMIMDFYNQYLANYTSAASKL